jgi:hypothetical protein
MKYGGHVTRWGIQALQTKLWFEKLKGIGCLGDIGVIEKVILKWVLKK